MTTDEERIKQIMDATMHHIITVTNQSKDKAQVMFGRRTLRDSLPFECTILQHNVAIDRLLTKKHIKKRGAHTVGIGTGQGIKAYNLDGYKPADITDIPADKVDEYGDKKHGKAEDAAPTTRVLNPEILIIDQPSAKVDENGMATVQLKPEIGGREQATETADDIDYALDELEHRLADSRDKVLNIELKTRVLDRLAAIVDPAISIVLIQIKHDLKGEAA